MARMTAKELQSKIRDLRNEKHMTFAEIADVLKKQGHVSPKTQKPLATASVRYLYFYGQDDDAPVADNRDAKKLDMIRSFLKLKADPKTKLELIEQQLNDT